MIDTVETIHPTLEEVEVTVLEEDNDDGIVEDNQEDEDELEHHEQKLRIHREKYGSNHLEVASTLYSLGILHFERDMLEAALTSFQESLRIRNHAWGTLHHKGCAGALYNIAQIYLELGDVPQALYYYQETIQVEQAALGPGHESVLQTMLQMGRVQLLEGESEKAVQCFLEIVDLLEKRQPEQPENDKESYLWLAKVYNDIGNVHLQSANTPEMVDALSKSARYLQLADSKNAVHHVSIKGLNMYSVKKMHPECAHCA